MTLNDQRLWFALSHHQRLWFSFPFSLESMWTITCDLLHDNIYVPVFFMQKYLTCDTYNFTLYKIVLHITIIIIRIIYIYIKHTWQWSVDNIFSKPVSSLFILFGVILNWECYLEFKWNCSFNKIGYFFNKIGYFLGYLISFLDIRNEWMFLIGYIVCKRKPWRINEIIPLSVMKC